MIYMEYIKSKCTTLRAQIAAAESQLADSKRKLSVLEAAADQLEDISNSNPNDEIKAKKWPLFAEEYRRYGRQMIVPQIGLQG
jgi:adenylyltransferase and sulfurtransferase